MILLPRRLMQQQGNVLFIVLAGIALFAALVMSFTRSDNTNSGAVLSQAEAKIAAASIMRFGSDVEQAVQRLMSLHGCDFTQLSFERSPFDGSDTDFVNPNSPADERCHVFSPNGGQVEYMTFEDKWKDESYVGTPTYGDWFYSIVCIGTGSAPNCNDTTEAARRATLFFFAPIIKLDICKEINLKLLGTDEILLDLNSLYRRTEPFVGELALNVPHINFASPNNTRKDLAMCVSTGGEPANNSYNYYNTLVLREDRYN